MEREQLLKAFTATVHASLLGLRELEPALQRERLALTSQNADDLSAAVSDKLEKLKAVEPSIVARDRLQQASGLKAGIDGGARLVDALGDESLQRDWRELTRLASEIARLNDVNGSIVAQSERTTRSALEILTGRPRNDVTYSELRRRQSGSAKHFLGKG
jgi:flagellar biosynthesis/type III secretory pathway chaperone